MNRLTRAVLLRLAVTFVISMIFGFAVSEITYRLSRSDMDTSPRRATRRACGGWA